MARTSEDDALKLYDAEDMDDAPDGTPLASAGGEESPADQASSVPAEAPDVAAASPEEAGAPSDRDLSRNADFRRFQAARDREIARLQRQLAEERQAQAAVEAQRLQNELDALLAKADDADDPTERRTLLHEAAQRQAYLLLQQHKRWESWKRSRLREAGFDPDDPRFERDYRSAEEFERDVLKAEVSALRKRMQSAGREPSVAAPDRRETVDIGEPSGSSFDLASDVAAFNSGRMSRAEFARRWGQQRR